jgi:sialic acid synthase SpsE
MGKPVFLSTGAATETEIKMAVSQLVSVPVVIMYCISSYPAKTVDLTVLDKLKLFSPFVGFSDHTTDAVYLPYAAYKFHGACVIEKHFNACKELTPDSPHSLSPTEFRLMVDRIRGKSEGRIGPSPEEQDMILRGKRRLVATEDIKRGDLFRRGQNFGPFRSLALDTKGMNPWNASMLHGKAASRDIQRGEGIGLSDFA